MIQSAIGEFKLGSDFSDEQFWGKYIWDIICHI